MTDDKFKGLDLDLEEDLSFEPPKRKGGGAKWGFIIVITLLIGVIGVMTYLLFFNTSPYEQGVIYLREKQYEAALIEFQKVPPADKDYNFAQSKINYITGMQFFNENKLDEAKPFLKQVAVNDEYANEVKFMLEKIDTFEKQKVLEDQLAEDQKKLIEDAQKETEQKIKDTEAAKKYFSELTRLIDKFESEYQLSKLESSSTMKKNLRNLNDIRQQMLDISYEADNQDQQVLDFRSLTDQLMKSRIDLVQKIISLNIESVDQVSDETKLEISDSDKLKESMVSERDKLKSSYGVK
ncbi:MAG: phage tail tape measure protein [Ignavibacteriae bacterium]|nr:phage tail tape measure protein [Ignavibacteriota bacterium]MCB9243792.1 phage tail tape measure protein [Ignavibacteriales bacterium]